MRGRERAKKKHLKRLGWRIVDEAHESDRAYRLELRGPDGQQVRIMAPTRPKAYRRAERKVAGPPGAEAAPATA